jgi:hypothetical protein
MIFSRQYDQPFNLINYINCVYVLELPTLEQRMSFDVDGCAARFTIILYR